MTRPLTPPECDLTDFPFMPIMIQRLKQSRSWLLCKRNPALAFYLINLWTAAWHAKPAASLEDDDLVLADLAICADKVWPKVREDVMRGWVLCDDGRLYHPVVAEQALEAWERKCAQRNRTEAARRARDLHRQAAQAGGSNGRNKDATGDVAVSVTENATEDATEIATEDVTQDATEDVTGSKGQGQGQGQGQKKEGVSRGCATSPPDLVGTSEAPSKRRGRPPKSLIPWPPDFALTPELREYATKHGFDGDWLFEKFRNKAISKGWEYRDWPSAFRNFAQSEQSYAPTGRSNGAQQDQTWRPPDV